MILKRRYGSFILALASVLLCACEQPEEPIVLPQVDGTLKLGSVQMGADYRTQIFMKLDDLSTVSIDNQSWDFYMDADSAGSNIYINGGKGVLISRTGYKQFRQMPDPNTLKWIWDAEDGDPDSLALSGWRDPGGNSYEEVYIVDRGSYIQGPDRYVQMKVLSVSGSDFRVMLADMHGADQHEVVVDKDPSKAHVYLSLEHGGHALNPEPARDAWDICFLRYRHVYPEFNPPLLYSVCGIYINTGELEAAVDSTLNFADVTWSTFPESRFNGKRNALGFDWKVYNFDNGRYVARSSVTYVVKTHSPLAYYKMRFIDFYDDNGTKGTPRFEMCRM
jgi:hypothetical protein